MKKFWIMFFADKNGVITGQAWPHNCVADYRGNPAFIGYQEINIDMGDLK